jgi:hypothetical protein
MLALRRLSFDETAQLALQIGQWCGVASAGPSTSLMRSRNRKMAMEDTLDKRVQAMTWYVTVVIFADSVATRIPVGEAIIQGRWHP